MSVRQSPLYEILYPWTLVVQEEQNKILWDSVEVAEQLFAMFMGWA